MNRCKQLGIAASAAVAPAAVAEQAPAVAEEAPAVAEEQPATPDGRARAAALTRILNTMVDIVDTSAEDRTATVTRFESPTDVRTLIVRLPMVSIDPFCDMACHMGV